MASHPSLFTAFLLFICTALFLIASTSSSQNVTLSLYYETLCPYCADFIVNHLVKVFDKGLISIVNLRLIPWGNAFIQPNGSFVCQVSTAIIFCFFCFLEVNSMFWITFFYGGVSKTLQHGTNECFLNAIEACTVTIYPDAVSLPCRNQFPNRIFSHVHGLLWSAACDGLIFTFFPWFRSGILDLYTVLRKCPWKTRWTSGLIALVWVGWAKHQLIATQVDMGKWWVSFLLTTVWLSDPIYTTAKFHFFNSLSLNDDEMQLQRKYAAETSQLNPPHRFVPWVVVNNQPLREVSLL
jgi:hypothetical protein